MHNFHNIVDYWCISVMVSFPANRHFGTSTYRNTALHPTQSSPNPCCMVEYSETLKRNTKPLIKNCKYLTYSFQPLFLSRSGLPPPHRAHTRVQPYAQLPPGARFPHRQGGCDSGVPLGQTFVRLCAARIAGTATGAQTNGAHECGSLHFKSTAL